MAVSGWGVDFTLVAGADLSAKQYQNVGKSAGILATSADNVDGIIQNKPQAGESITVRRFGVSKIYLPTSLGAGAEIMQSNATSGVIALATSGYCSFGYLLDAASSGSIGTAWLYGGAIKRLLA
ncbi:MAG: hypothetical protein M0Z38_04340 [Deltaproteobacteria bacterium]|nr:hypothetical protein [Deltaproteobacteria bacterium]